MPAEKGKSPEFKEAFLFNWMTALALRNALLRTCAIRKHKLVRSVPFYSEITAAWQLHFF
jgi:hypothetical protein